MIIQKKEEQRVPPDVFNSTIYHDLLSEDKADEMSQEGLPEEFVDIILTGWWTTCLEILPARERARGQF